MFVEDGQMRIERVVLKDHRHVAVLGGASCVALADLNRAGIELLESGHHAERCGLSAPGRPDEDMNSPSAMSRSSASTAGSSFPG